MDAHEQLELRENEDGLLAVVYSKGDTYTVVRFTGPEHEDPERSVRVSLLHARGFRRCGVLGWHGGKMDATYEQDPVSLRVMRHACETFAVTMAGQTAPPLASTGVTAEWLYALYALEDTRDLRSEADKD